MGYSGVIWQYHPSDMYIHLHKICFIVDGIRYGYISFRANSALISMVDFSVDIVAPKKYFRWKFKVRLKFICADFQFFPTFSEYDIIILVKSFHGNSSLTSCSSWSDIKPNHPVRIIDVTVMMSWHGRFPHYWPSFEKKSVDSLVLLTWKSHWINELPVVTHVTSLQCFLWT